MQKIKDNEEMERTLAAQDKVIETQKRYISLLNQLIDKQQEQIRLLEMQNEQTPRSLDR